MPKIKRDYVFQNGKKANANEVNTEFDKLHTLINGQLDSENLLDGGIEKSKLAFLLASDKFLGSADDYNGLSAFTEARHGDVAIVNSPVSGGEMSLYMYNDNRMVWEKIAGTVQTPTHNSLTGREIADAHPIVAITGLEQRLTGIETKDTTQDTKITANTTKIANLDNRLGGAEASLDLKLSPNDFGANLFGLGGTAKPVPDGNIDQVLPTGWYQGNAITGAPDVNHFTFEVIRYNATTCLQKAYRMSPSNYFELYHRYGNASGFQPWLKILDEKAGVLMDSSFAVQPNGKAIDLGANGAGNIENIVKNGLYSGSQLVGAPVEAAGTLLHIEHRSNNHATQLFTSVAGVHSQFYRSKTTGTWGAWNKVATKRTITTTMAAGAINIITNISQDAVIQVLFNTSGNSWDLAKPSYILSDSHVGVHYDGGWKLNNGTGKTANIRITVID